MLICNVKIPKNRYSKNMNAARAEETGYIASGGAWLYSCYHPAAGKSEGGLLILPPFGEERKCSYRLLVEMARRLSRSFDVLRFDYAGAGESSGDHAEMTLGHWLRDSRAALAQLQSRSKAGNCWLLGARLGANLALRLAAPEIAGLALWEPLLSGDDYLNEMIRRKQIKEMMGGGKASSLAEELTKQWECGEAVDFDGFAVSADLAGELKEMDFAADLALLEDQRALLVHVSGAKRLSNDWARLQKEFDQAPNRRFISIRQKPFWGLLDYQESEELKSETVAFCRPLAAS